MNVKQAPLMLVRCDAESLLQSFQTTEQIPATLYALYQYMQQHAAPGRKFSGDELGSIKFRHRSPNQQREDTHPPITGLENQWSAAWQIRFVKDEDRRQAEEKAKLSNKKVILPHTVFGYCSQFPIA